MPQNARFKLIILRACYTTKSTYISHLGLISPPSFSMFIYRNLINTVIMGYNTERLVRHDFSHIAHMNTWGSTQLGRICVIHTMRNILKRNRENFKHVDLNQIPQNLQKHIWSIIHDFIVKFLLFVLLAYPMQTTVVKCLKMDSILHVSGYFYNGIILFRIV